MKECLGQISHLPWLQLIQSAAALPAEWPPPWLTLQHIIKRIRQSVHSFVHVILWSEVRQIHELSLCILQKFPSSAQMPCSICPTCWRWCESALKCVLPELLYLFSIQKGNISETSLFFQLIILHG